MGEIQRLRSTALRCGAVDLAPCGERAGGDGARPSSYGDLLWQWSGHGMENLQLHGGVEQVSSHSDVIGSQGCHTGIKGTCEDAMGPGKKDS